MLNITSSGSSFFLSLGSKKPSKDSYATKPSSASELRHTMQNEFGMPTQVRNNISLFTVFDGVYNTCNILQILFFMHVVFFTDIFDMWCFLIVSMLWDSGTWSPTSSYCGLQGRT